MTAVAIFLLGLIVSSVTGVGALLIGLEEAADPSQSRLEDLSKFERKVVGRGDVEKATVGGIELSES